MSSFTNANRQSGSPAPPAGAGPEVVRLVRSGDAEGLRQLVIDEGANIDDPVDPECCAWTPLQLMCAEGDAAAVKLLLELKADPGRSLFFDAVRRQQRAKPLDASDVTNVEDAKEELRRLRKMMRDEADIEAKSADGAARPRPVGDERYNALHVAARYGHADIIELLLEAGAGADSPDKWGQTPLHYASANGHEKAVRLLLDKGAYAHLADDDENTPLDMAEAAGHAAIAKLLRKSLGDHGGALTGAGVLGGAWFGGGG